MALRLFKKFPELRNKRARGMSPLRRFKSTLRSREGLDAIHPPIKIGGLLRLHYIKNNLIYVFYRQCYTSPNIDVGIDNEQININANRYRKSSVICRI